jgi:hypothetical protein
MKLKTLSVKFNIEGEEQLEELAEEITSKVEAPKIKTDSGLTSGSKTVPDSAKGKIKQGWADIHK